MRGGLGDEAAARRLADLKLELETAALGRLASGGAPADDDARTAWQAEAMRGEQMDVEGKGTPGEGGTHVARGGSPARTRRETDRRPREKASEI